MQREAKRIKKELSSIHVEAEADGVKVVVSAEMEVISVEIADTTPRERVPNLIKDAMNRAMKKAQVVSAEKMQGLMGQMGMPTGS